MTNTAPDAGADISISEDEDEIEATLTIVDDDFGFVTIAGADGYEGINDGVFTVTLRDANGDPTTATEDITVTYSLVETGTANEGVGPANLNSEDFAELTRTVVILAGDTSADVIIDINDDTLLEGRETVTLNIESVSSDLIPIAGIDRVFRGALGGPEVSFRQGVDGFFGVVDTFVREGDPLTNFSSDITVQQNNDIDGVSLDDGVEVGLLRFDGIFGTGFGQIPLGSAIAGAGLNLTRGPLSPSGGIAVHNLLVDFDFTTISHTSIESFTNGVAGIQADGIEAESDFSALGTIGGGLFGSTPVIDVTNSITAFSGGQDNFGFAIFDTSGGLGTSFFSSDAAGIGARPELTVTIDTSATIHISDNDEAVVAITNTTDAAEETTDGIVTVTLTGADLPVGYNLVIPYTVGGGGSATPDADFVADSGFITIPGGTNSGTFSVEVLADFLIEGTEDVQVSIGAPTVQAVGADTTVEQALAINGLITVGTDTETVDILDDDGGTLAVTLVGDGSELPAASGSVDNHTDTVFRISLTGTTSAGSTSTTATTVSFTITTDLIDGSDFIAPTVTDVTIPAFASFVELEIDILDDLLNEFDHGPELAEFLTFTLTPGSVDGNPGITVSPTDGSATDYIADDDDLVASITAEDEDGIASEVPEHLPTTLQDDGVFTISLNFASDAQTTVPFVINDGYGLGGSVADLPTAFDPDSGNPISPDYELVGGPEIIWETPTSGYAVFGPSETPQSTTITVVATQDFDPTESDEFITIDIVDEILTDSGSDSVALNNPNRLPGDPDNVGGAGDSATVTILDETYVVTLDNTDSPAQEDGLGGVGFNGQFTVNISNKTQVGNDVTVAFEIASDVNIPGINNGSSTNLATYGQDYILTAGTDGSVLTIDPHSIGTDTITGTVTIPGGEKFALLDIEVIADTVVEGELDDSVPQVYVENVPLTITSATSDFGQTPSDSVDIAELGAETSRTESIIDNDSADVTVQVVDDDGDAVGPDFDLIGEGPAFDDGSFRFSLNAPVQGRDVVVTYSIVAAGTTAEVADHAVSNGTITIPAGSTFADLPINPFDDLDVEGSETLTVRIDAVAEVDAGTSISNPHGEVGIGSVFQDTVVIQDNDTATVTIEAIDEEATEDGVRGRFEITLSQPAEIDLIIRYDVGGGVDEAVAGAAIGDGIDYEELSGFVLIPAGETSALIDVEAFEDSVIEGDESVTLTLTTVEDTAGNSQTLVTASGSDQVFIRSNDTTTAVLSRTSDAFEEGTVGGVYTVTIDTPADVDLTFTLADVTDSGIGFADAGDDFNTSATVVILAGELTGTVTIDPVDDTLAEGDEIVTFVLDSVSAADPFDFVIPDDDGNIPTVADIVALDATEVDLTIVDNDVPTFTVSSVALEEGTDGTFTEFEFTITHNGELASNVDITPSLALTTGLTVGGTDFAFPGSAPTFTFTPADGTTSTRTFIVNVFNDNIHEADEVFTVSLTDVTTGPVVSTGTGTGTIINDDFVEFSIIPGFPSVFEGTSSTPYGEGGPFSSLTFSVVPSIPVDIAIPVDVNYLDLGGTFGDPAAFGADFELIFAPFGSQSLPFGTDFDNGTDSIEFGALSTTPIGVEVLIVQDNLVEGGDSFADESLGYEEFQTDLSTSNTSRPGITFDDTSLFIHDDDGATVTVTSNDPNLTEGGGEPFGDGSFTFSVINPVQEAVVISYSVTVDGAAGDPGNDIEDFATVFTGTITIPANDTLGGSPVTSVTLPFSALEDSLLENNEDVVVTITGVSSDSDVDFDDTPAVAEIQDNDTSLLSFTATPSATEGGGTATLTFDLTQQSDTPTTFTLDFDGSSSDAENADFTITLPNGTVINSLPAQLTIPANTSTYSVTLTAVNDSLTEDPEDLDLFIAGPVFGNADIEIDTASDSDTVVINDDGDGFTVEITAYSEGQEDDIDGSFTFTLFNSFGVEEALPFGSTPSGAGIEIQYAIVPEGTSATNAVDFSFNEGTVTILEGQSSNILTFDVLEDFEIEGIETVEIVITGVIFATGANDAVASGLLNGEEISIDLASHTNNIIDNDFPAPEVSGVFVNSTFFDAQFRDEVDGDADGSTFGYELNAANANETVPFVNINEIVVRFDTPVDPASLDISDFSLVGLVDSGTKFDPGEADGLVPTIVSVTPDADNLTVRLTLSNFLEPAVLDFSVDGSGLTSLSGGAGTDYDQQFIALPGDVNSSQRVLFSGDVTSIIPRIGAAIGDANYDFRADVDGSGRILFADAAQTIGKLGDFITPPAPPTAFNSVLPPQFTTEGIKSTDEPTKSEPSTIESPKSALAGSVLDSSESKRQTDVAFEELFSEDKEDSKKESFNKIETTLLK